jgi:hypothetical protein
MQTARPGKSPADIIAPIALVRDRAEPEPALRSDAGRWIGQRTVLVYLGPEVVETLTLGERVLHSNILAGTVAATDTARLFWEC